MVAVSLRAPGNFVFLSWLKEANLETVIISADCGVTILEYLIHLVIRYSAPLK